ncbi:hypothetical protein ABZ342_11400 [Amycolatopsis sp. NPDC005961]|uniref:Uncharacterized protein n=1 Tax=Amycolatopsis camponoti TaxID=2606593 RepID=A0A6I8LJE5_9PSEU|nr:hypothetical protein [Amycolatopsis camponoti]VVJ17191.1 Uncharacterised protein [Amycolatopsis camponoti]
MLSVLEHPSSGWVLAMLAIGTVVHQIVRLMMFKAAIRNSKPAERPQIIKAMRGLIGRGLSSRTDDKE